MNEDSGRFRSFTLFIGVVALLTAVQGTAGSIQEATCRVEAEDCVCVSWEAANGEQIHAICPVPSMSALQAPVSESCRDELQSDTNGAIDGIRVQQVSPLTSSQQACLYAAQKTALAPGRLRPGRSDALEERPNACMLLFAGFVDQGFGSGAAIVGEYTEYRWAEGAKIPGNPCDRPGIAAWTNAPGSHDRFVMLCREFCELPVAERATVLIHEGLHTAGMPERPPDPNAPTSQDISSLVRNECRL